MIQFICPRFGKECNKYPAISRADNKTEICPKCGTIEALEADGADQAKQRMILHLVYPDEE